MNIQDVATVGNETFTRVPAGLAVEPLAAGISPLAGGKEGGVH